jgi:hypothetical protein
MDAFLASDVAARAGSGRSIGVRHGGRWRRVVRSREMVAGRSAGTKNVLSVGWSHGGRVEGGHDLDNNDGNDRREPELGLACMMVARWVDVEGFKVMWN